MPFGEGTTPLKSLVILLAYWMVSDTKESWETHKWNRYEIYYLIFRLGGSLPGVYVCLHARTFDISQSFLLFRLIFHVPFSILILIRAYNSFTDFYTTKYIPITFPPFKKKKKTDTHSSRHYTSNFCIQLLIRPIRKVCEL